VSTSATAVRAAARLSFTERGGGSAATTSGATTRREPSQDVVSADQCALLCTGKFCDFLQHFQVALLLLCQLYCHTAASCTLNCLLCNSR
jgi:hypothetical protein